MTTALVTIIIPCFNAEDTIEHTLTNCASQTHSQLEILVVDDHSTDNTKKIIQAFAQKDPRVVLLINEQKGAQFARNLGVEKASGEFLKFLDSDDLMDLDLIERQVLLLRDAPGAVANSRWAKFSDNVASSKPEPQPCDKTYANPEDFLADLWNGNMYPIHSWLVPKIILAQGLRWDTSISQNQDGEFFARVVDAADEVKHCPRTAYYRQPSGGRSHISQRKGVDAIQSQIKALKTFKSIADKSPSHILLKQAFDRQAFNVAYRATNSIEEGRYLDQVLELLSLEKDATLRFPSMALQILAGVVGIRHSLYLRRWTKLMFNRG